LFCLDIKEVFAEVDAEFVGFFRLLDSFFTLDSFSSIDFSLFFFLASDLSSQEKQAHKAQLLVLACIPLRCHLE